MKIKIYQNLVIIAQNESEYKKNWSDYRKCEILYKI